MRIGICDDDEETRKKIYSIISMTLFKYTDPDFVYYSDGEEVVEAVKKNKFAVDLLFLDINMPKLDGLKTAAFLRHKRVDVDIVFLTASKEKVFEGYTYKAVAYCIKPVEKAGLEQVIERYMQDKDSHPDCLNVPVNGVRESILIDRIQYIDSQTRKVTVHTLAEDYTFYSKLDDIEKMLEGHDFLRCHQSYMVNRKMIDSINRSEIIVAGVSVPVSRKYYDKVQGINKPESSVKITKSLAMNREEGGAVIFTKGSLLGLILRIRADRNITLGSDAVQSDVVVAGENVSGLHCAVLYRAEQGDYVIRDYSRTGVFKGDGERIPSNEGVIFEKGAELRLGGDENIIRLG